MTNPNEYYEPSCGKRLTPAGETKNGVDEVTGADICIDTDHASIHKKSGYSLAVDFGSIAAGVSRYISVVTPADIYLHFKDASIWTGGAQASLEIYEGATFTGGTLITPINRNRVSTPEESATVCNKLLATVNTSGAVLIDSLVFGGGGGAASKSGGIGSIKPELVLRPATTYVFHIKNEDATASDVHTWFFWYEEAAGVA